MTTPPAAPRRCKVYINICSVFKLFLCKFVEGNLNVNVMIHNKAHQAHGMYGLLE